MAIDATVGGGAANSYATVAAATAYFAVIGGTAETTWTAADTTAKEDALARATQYVEARWSGRWPGVPASIEQALAWPRVQRRAAMGYVYLSSIYRPLLDADGRMVPPEAIPVPIVQATCELALDALSETDLFAGEATASTREETVKVGPIEQKTVFSSAPVTQGARRNVEAILRPLLKRGLSRC